MIHIELPDIEIILNCSEKDFLQPVVMQPAELQQLNETVERTTSGSCTQGTDVNKNVTKLRGKGCIDDLPTGYGSLQSLLFSWFWEFFGLFDVNLPIDIAPVYGNAH